MSPLLRLPGECFVDFECFEVASPRYVWKNDSAGSTVDLRDFAFCRPLNSGEDGFFTKKARVFQAERYGGGGLAGNGGGARCGLFAGIQIKGIGQTPVAGRDAEYWHSHGAASLEEAVREAVWGEVCHLALPHGSVRTLGIILTGSDAPYDAREGPTRSRRALIVREASLRPAHFMRAIRFKPHAHVQMLPDVERTRAAIQVLPSVLEALTGKQVGNTYALQESLGELAARSAEQLAAAQARRLMHGAFDASNMCLDGAWVDFGTITAVSDYGRIIVSRHGQDYWNQQQPLLHAFSELAFYAGKFLRLPRGSVGELISAIRKDFLETLGRRTQWEFAKLLGASDHQLQQVDPRLIDAFFRQALDLIRRGNAEPFKFSPTHVSEMPETMGRYNLGRCLQRLAARHTAAGMVEALIEEIDDIALRRRLAESAWALREACIQAEPEARRPQVRIHMMVEGLRANIALNTLYRSNLDQTITRLVEQPEGVESGISAIMSDARLIFGRNADDMEDSALTGAGASLDAANSCPVLLRGLIDRCLETFRTSMISESLKKDARDYAEEFL